jgi:DNA-binding NarL/FixJ family response regulator
MIYLTRHEMDILARVCDCKQNKVIASDLGMGEQTIKTYLTQIFKKFEVNSRMELLKKAVQMGLVKI